MQHQWTALGTPNVQFAGLARSAPGQSFHVISSSTLSPEIGLSALIVSRTSLKPLPADPLPISAGQSAAAEIYSPPLLLRMTLFAAKMRWLPFINCADSRFHGFRRDTLLDLRVLGAWVSLYLVRDRTGLQRAAKCCPFSAATQVDRGEPIAWRSAGRHEQKLVLQAKPWLPKPAGLLQHSCHKPGSAGPGSQPGIMAAS